jgi:hypothetical protein
MNQEREPFDLPIGCRFIPDHNAHVKLHNDILEQGDRMGIRLLLGSVLQELVEIKKLLKRKKRKKK